MSGHVSITIIKAEKAEIPSRREYWNKRPLYPISKQITYPKDKEKLMGQVMEAMSGLVLRTYSGKSYPHAQPWQKCSMVKQTVCFCLSRKYSCEPTHSLFKNNPLQQQPVKLIRGWGRKTSLVKRLL